MTAEEGPSRFTFNLPDDVETVTAEAAAALVGTTTTLRFGNVTVPALIVGAERYNDAVGSGVRVTCESAPLIEPSTLTAHLSIGET